MCGIAGIITPFNPNDIMHRMISLLHHRGPDSQGIKTIKLNNKQVALGNTRLSIIDLSPFANMPMMDAETGNIITYNGEIYNFQNLRLELESYGHHFTTFSDTEVLLKAYRQWGRSCIEHLRGMFAFAIWDAKKQELFLARDRLGEKPLYYYRHKDIFAFASEIRSLIHSKIFQPTIDAFGLRMLLYNGFIISPTTFIKDIFSLNPGHYLVVDLQNKIEITRYWEIPSYHHEIESTVSIEELRYELEQALAMRLVSDVGIGIFLSGGLDSTLITAIAKKNTKDIHTFSIGFSEKKWDESRYAQLVAEKYETMHHSFTIDQNHFNSLLDEFIEAMDQPTFDGLNTFIISKITSQNNFKVALSGLGADELFGGYPHFKHIPYLYNFIKKSRLDNFNTFKFLGKFTGYKGIRKIFQYFDDPNKLPGLELLALYQSYQSLFPEKMLKELFDQFLDKNNPLWFGLSAQHLNLNNLLFIEGDIYSKLSYYTLKFFQGERLLRDTDNFSMACSFELRTVFTDHIFVEKVTTFSGRIRCRNPMIKSFERELAKPYLGNNYSYRYKRGFILPFQKWLQSKNNLKKIKDSILDKSVLENLGFKYSNIDNFVHFEKKSWSRIWLLYILVRWAKQHNLSVSG